MKEHWRKGSFLSLSLLFSLIKDESHSFYGTPQALYYRWKSRKVSKRFVSLRKEILTHFPLADLLTGYEGEFVSEDSLLTALQVQNQSMQCRLWNWTNMNERGKSNEKLLSNQIIKQIQLKLSGCRKTWRHGHWPAHWGNWLAMRRKRKKSTCFLSRSTVTPWRTPPPASCPALTLTNNAPTRGSSWTTWAGSAPSWRRSRSQFRRRPPGAAWLSTMDRAAPSRQAQAPPWFPAALLLTHWWPTTAPHPY